LFSRVSVVREGDQKKKSRLPGRVDGQRQTEGAVSIGTNKKSRLPAITGRRLIGKEGLAVVAPGGSLLPARHS